jgi:hypothetical protein
LYILIFIFLDSKLEDRRFCTEWQLFPYCSLLLISYRVIFLCIKVFSKYLKCSTFSKSVLSIFTLWLRPAF